MASGDDLPTWGERSISPEGFIVEELPDGDGTPDPGGTHVWFTVEKRGIATTVAAARIARALGRSPESVGFAGRKDARAVTRQRMSLEHVTPDDLLALDLPGIRVRDPFRNRSKLRLGALEGNRFHLRLDGAREDERDRIAGALDDIARQGVPNAYGPQRFGRDGRGWELGLVLCTGSADAYFERLVEDEQARSRPAAEDLLERIRSGEPARRRGAAGLARDLGPELGPVARQAARRRTSTIEELVRAVPRRSRAFQLSMLQARVFNDVLEERVAAGTHGAVNEGDVAERLTFASPPRDVPTGPIWSPRMVRAEGAVAEAEERALRARGLAIDDLESPGHLHPKGARRPLVSPIRHASVEWRAAPSGAGGALWLAFDLPVGAYATVVLDALRSRVD